MTWLVTWLVLGLGLIGAGFALGVYVARRSSLATGAPTDPSAAVQVQTAPAQDAAAAQATVAAQAQAKAELTASDADVTARVEQLRARGRAGE